MLFYNHVPSAVFESAPQESISPLQTHKRQGDWWASLTRPASHSGSSVGTLAPSCPASIPSRLSGKWGLQDCNSLHLLLPHHSLVLTGSLLQPVQQAAQPPVSWWVIFSSAQRGRKQGGPERSLLGSLLDNCKLLPGKAEMVTRVPKQKNSKRSQKEGARKIKQEMLREK